MIKFVFRPSVYMIAQSTLNVPETKRFLVREGIEDCEQFKRTPENQNTEIDLIPEFAGRLCYMSFSGKRPGGNKKYLEHILEAGHGSVLEHSTISLAFTGVSRSLTHELVRHRAGFGYSQLSQRYVDESEMCVVVPPEYSACVSDFLLANGDAFNMTVVGGDCEYLVSTKTLDEFETALDECHLNHMDDKAVEIIMARRWLSTTLVSHRMYALMVKSTLDRMGFDSTLPIDTKTFMRKRARGSARSLLPNATETKIMVTGNARAWRTFLEQRGSMAADIEIRNLAVMTFKYLSKIMPNICQDIELLPVPKEHLPDEPCPPESYGYLNVKNRKV